MAKTSPSQEVIEELELELERKIKEREAILDELSLLDLQIDKYDVLIKEIDKEAFSAVTVLNNAIYNVKSSYDARISSGVRTNLVWELQTVVNTNPYGIGAATTSLNTYKAVVNTATQVTKNLYGLKYYQKPANRDYGSNFIADFNGNISAGSTIMAVLPGTAVENNLDAYSVGDLTDSELTVKIGDTVTDDLEEPTIFSSTNLPTIVGFGTTQVIGIITSVVGGISTGSNKFAHFGAGDFSMISVGQYLIGPKVTGFASVFNESPLPPKIVGFGTTVISLEYFNSSGILTSSNFVSNTFLLDKTAINGLQEGTFSVGVLTTCNAYFLSTVSLATTSFESFSVYRFDEDIDADFDDEKDPNNPVKIGILNSSTLGVGSKLELNSSGGTETGPKSYDQYEYDKKGKKKEEPDIGAGSVTWNTGTTQYPIIGGFYGIGGSYATEGAEIKIDTSNIGAPTPQYTSTPPPGTPGSGSFDSAISSANSALSSVESGDSSSVAQSGVTAAAGLRKERDEKEIYAWSLLQSASTARKRISQIQTTLSSLKNTDYAKYEK
jgi:hypothetical protein